METKICWCNFVARNPQSVQLNVSWKPRMNMNMIIITAAAKLPITTPPSKHATTITTTKPRFPWLVNDVLNNLDDLIRAFLDKPLDPGNNPRDVLGQNFKPVSLEVSPTPCHVIEGSLPACLDGAYIRNGPNPKFPPRGPYNFLDGDGMLHMVRISRGEATFCSRYVRTHKFESEAQLGGPVVPNFIACFNNGTAASVARSMLVAARVLIARQFDPLGHGFGVANTSVALISGRLFALCESDLPYEISVAENGDVTTLGRHRFETVEPSFVRMTAHPKTDRSTGETFAYRYDPLCRPFLTFHRIDRDGRKMNDVPIHSKRDCTIVHDIGLTESRVVFPDIQLVINPRWIFAWGRGYVLGMDDRKVPRLGIIPRYAEDEGEMRWVETPGLNMLHCVNAWDDDEDNNNIVMVCTNAGKVEHLIGEMRFLELTLEKVTIDVKAKRVERKRLSSNGRLHEFGTFNPAYANKKMRYVYAGVLSSRSRSIVGVEKFDLSINGCDCTVASRMYGPGCHTGESLFVAKDPNNPMAEEDDGYLITYVHDDNTEESRFLVMDAKSPDLEIVAAVKLPQRVPNGFHGLFVSEEELNNLRSK